MTDISVPLGASAALLLLALYSDLKAMRIPNLLTAPFFIAGLGYHVIDSGFSGGIHALTGALSGFVPLLALYLLKGIGAGDVKLFAALGAWVGAASVLQVLAYTILFAGGIGVIMLFIHRPFGRRLMAGTAALLMPAVWSRREIFQAWSKDGLRFPFMIAVVPGALTAWIFTV